MPHVREARVGRMRPTRGDGLGSRPGRGPLQLRTGPTQATLVLPVLTISGPADLLAGGEGDDLVVRVEDDRLASLHAHHPVHHESSAALEPGNGGPAVEDQGDGAGGVGHDGRCVHAGET